MAKKRNPQREAWQAEARERLSTVLEKKYEGNQSQLAAALGVTRALISIVLRKVQPPTKNLMARLGTLPGINPRWAADGEGEPFGPDTHGTLPVATGILPGWPERHTELMTGERWPTAEAFIRPSRYWLRVEPTCPALRAAELALLAQDLLLMDADTAVWADRLGDCAGRLFGVRVRRDAQTSYQLALLRRVTTGLVFDAFSESHQFAMPSPSPAVPPAPMQSLPVGVRAKRKVRSLKLVEETGEADGREAKSASAPTTPPSDVPFVTMAHVGHPITITSEDIIAIRVGMYRS